MKPITSWEMFPSWQHYPDTEGTLWLLWVLFLCSGSFIRVDTRWQWGHGNCMALHFGSQQDTLFILNLNIFFPCLILDYSWCCMFYFSMCTATLQKAIQQPGVFFLLFNLPQQTAEFSYPTWVKWSFCCSLSWPGKTCSSNALMSTGPDSSAWFQHPTSPLITMLWWQKQQWPSFLLLKSIHSTLEMGNSF